MAAYAVPEYVIDADEADWIEQSIPVGADDTDEYPYTHHHEHEIEGVLPADPVPA